MAIGVKTGGGSRKGSQNKTTKALREMVLAALDEAGGQAYLVRCAKDPKLAGAFLALLGKVLPSTLNASTGAPIVISWEREKAG